MLNEKEKITRKDFIKRIGIGLLAIPLIAPNVNAKTLFFGNNAKLTDLDANKVVLTDANKNLVSSTVSASILNSLSGVNTGDQTITLTGDVTGSGTGSFATTIANNAVTTAKILDDNVTLDKLQNATTNNLLLGRYTTGAGSFQEIVLGSNLSLSGNTLNAEGGAGTATWGGISGTLSDQTDLNTKLEAVEKDAITFTFAGSTTGIKQYGVADYAFTIKSWRVVSKSAGDLVVDIWKASGAKPTSSAQSITGSEKPTLSTSDLASDTDLTTWTTSVSAGDVLAFNIDSIAGVDSFTLVLGIEK